MNLSADPLFHNGSMPRCKPGRPLGSKVQVGQDARALGVLRFAFVRCSILGLDLAEPACSRLRTLGTGPSMHCFYVSRLKCQVKPSDRSND